jgi:hypothetical protein
MAPAMTNYTGPMPAMEAIAYAIRSIRASDQPNARAAIEGLESARGAMINRGRRRVGLPIQASPRPDWLPPREFPDEAPQTVDSEAEAGANGMTAQPPGSKAEWKPPPEFDVIKELNGHAGRLATLLGLVVAASALSLSNDPIKDTLVKFDLSAHPVVYGALALAGLCLFIGLISVIRALDPAASVAAWVRLPQRAYRSRNSRCCSGTLARR